MESFVFRYSIRILVHEYGLQNCDVKEFDAYIETFWRKRLAPSSM
jgi:hypothetical protein